MGSMKGSERRAAVFRSLFSGLLRFMSLYLGKMQSIMKKKGRDGAAMKRKIAALLVAALLLIVTIVPAMAITVEQDMYLLYKTDERLDENGNKYVDLIFCYVDESSDDVRLRTFDRKEPMNSAEPGDIVNADVIFGRSGCEAKAFFDEDRGYWVVRLTTPMRRRWRIFQPLRCK